MTRSWRIALLSATLAFLAGSVAITLTKAPWWDEGLFASPAYNLAYRGFMGSTVWVSQYQVRSLPGIDKHIYTWLPLYPVALALWIKAFGYSIVTMRLMSLAWGLLGLAALYGIVLALTKKHRPAAIAFILLATDYTYISEAALARYDTMPCALGFCGLAAYLWWRERSFNRAVLIGSAFVSASIFTHPMGLLHLAGLVILIIYFDWRKIRLRTIGLGILPFIVLGIGWGSYILKAPQDFRAQFLNHSAHRVGGLASPLYTVSKDFAARYMVAFWTTLHGWNKLKIMVVALYIAGIVGGVLTPALRKGAPVRVLIMLATVYYVGIAVLDTLKSPHYFIQLFPVLLALTAIWTDHALELSRPWRVLVSAAALLLIFVQLGGVALQARLNSWKTIYNPVIAYIQQHSRAGDLIIGPAELTFGLGQGANLKDDCRLGYGTNWRPKLIVKNEFYMWGYFRDHYPPIYDFVEHRLQDEYHVVFELDKYTIYAPDNPAATM